MRIYGFIKVYKLGENKRDERGRFTCVTFEKSRYILMDMDFFFYNYEVENSSESTKVFERASDGISAKQ